LFAKHRDRQHIFQRLTYRNAGRTLQQIGREPLLEPGLSAKRSPRSAGYTALSFFAGKPRSNRMRFLWERIHSRRGRYMRRLKDRLPE
jgi:hypothetical protein